MTIRPPSLATGTNPTGTATSSREPFLPQCAKGEPELADYLFVVNLRSETFDDSFRKWLKPRAYLLAPNRASGAELALAGNVRKGRYQLYADNGNFALIGQIVKRYAGDAAALLQAVRTEEKKLRHSARPGELSKALTARIAELAAKARNDADKNREKSEAALKKMQLAIRPTRMIGVEDTTMALWLALNLEPEYLPYTRSDYRKINEAVARRAAAERKTLPAELTKACYPVASALSYDTAYDAGQAFAEQGLERVSMGFGAYMADDHYTDHVIIRERLVELQDLMPNRYLRTALVARGFWDGYRKKAGRPPEAFHFLGLGAPIMVGLVALSSWGTTELTFDATSPIKDAVEGTLYVSKPAYLKIRTQKSALRLASGKGKTWDCPCPFCRDFVRKHPFDYEKGSAWYKEKPAEAKAADLAPGGALYGAYPLLSEPKGGELRKAVTFTRMGHNHWVLQDIMAELKKNATSLVKLKKHIEGVVSAYEGNTASETFAGAVRFAFKLATGEKI
jgi:hypothetical protein